MTWSIIAKDAASGSFGIAVATKFFAVGARVPHIASGCGADTATSSKAAEKKPAKPTCPTAWKAGWQRLANRIHAPVYCPSWLPDPTVSRRVQ